MKLWVITARAFLEGEYFDRLEKTIVAKTAEEARDIFARECNYQQDWFWDGVDSDGPYDSNFDDENTYVLESFEAHSVVTLREVEI